VLDLSHNKLQVLLPKVFDSLDLDRVYLQHNDLSQLHTETFRGLTLSKNGILDMSRYKLQDLPPKVFDGMRGLKILDLAENELRSLGDRLEQNQLAHLDGVEPGWQPPHNVTQRPLQRFRKSSKAAAAEQSAGETSAKAVSDSWQSSLGVVRTLEYVMQDDSLIFSVINHLSNKIIVLYVMQSFSLASPWPFGGCTKPSFTDGGRPHPTDTPSVIPRSREY